MQGRAARSIVDTMDKPCNAADAPLLANPFGTGQISPHAALSPPYWVTTQSRRPPPCLRGNLPRSRPREILRQAPGPRPALSCFGPLYFGRF